MEDVLASRFVLDGGDGDQSFFGSPQILQVEPSLQNARPDGVDAFVMRVSEGTRKGRLVVLTPRTLIPLMESIQLYEMASVIVHLQSEGTAGIEYDDISSNRRAIGMSFLQIAR